MKFINKKAKKVRNELVCEEKVSIFAAALEGIEERG